MLSRFILLMFPNKTLFNTPASFVLLLPLLLFCWCVGVSQEEVILNEEIDLDVSLGQNSSPIRNYHKDPNKLGNILHQNHATTAATKRATRIITSQDATRPYIHKHIFSVYGNKVLLTEKRKDKNKNVTVGINNNTCGDNSGCNSHGSETVLEKQEKHITEPSVPLSENKDVLQKDDVHIKILDTDARRRRDRSPFNRWWPRRNRRRYWNPSRRDRKWWKRNRRRWRQRPNMTTPLPTSTALIDTDTGDRRVIITRPGHRERPSQNQTGGSTSISQHKGYAYWNVPPFVLKMKRKLEYKIRQMSNMVYNGLSETLYNITRRSKYIVNKHSALKEEASQLISDTHDEIENIVELNNHIYDTVLTISAFHRRLYERLYEQGPSPTPGAIPNTTAFVKRSYSQLNREALILLRTMKHMRNKFFHLNHTYAKHINYYYDRLDRIRDVISSHRIRIGDLMDMAMYVNNQMSNLTRLKMPSILREIYDERHKLITVNYQSRHQLHVTEQVHQDVTTFQKSCQLRLQELSQFNYTILKILPKPTTTPLTFKEKRKLQLLVNRVKGHTENILKTAAVIDSLLPPVITSAKELILKLSMESQSDSYKVWALGKILKQWDKMASAVHGNTGRRKWMKTRRRRIRRMRKRMPKSLISKRKKREADVLEEDIDKIYEEIIRILTQIIKRLDDMWMKLFEVSSGNIGKCEKLDTEGSGDDDTEVECEVEGSGKMDITESESGTTTSESLAGKNDHDDSNDFEFTDVKTVVVSSHREHLQSIVSASLSRSKKQLKISRNLVNDVQDIKSSLAEVKATKRKLENNVNKSTESVSLYHELVSNATEMRRLINETEQKINASQVKCLAAQKLADHVLADKDELERLLEVKKKEKEKERKEKEANEKDGDNEKVRKKKKRKKLKDKSNDNGVDLNGRRENEGKRRKDKDKDNDGRVEVDASKKELEENERTKAELKALIEKYLSLQKEEDEEKRKNEERGKKKKITNVESEEAEDKKERKTKKRRKKNRRDDLKKKNHQRRESVDEQRNKQERNKTGKRRKEDDNLPSKSDEKVEGKRKKKKKLTENGKNENDVNKVTDENTEKETKKKLSEIDVNSVLEIKKNLEDVLKKLNQKLEGSKNWSDRQRRKRRRRRKIELASKKRDRKRNRNKGVMADKEMINDKETSKELNEKEESGNEDKKKKKRRKVKNEGEDRKADAVEEVIENLEESWKNNSTEKKSRKKDINEEMNEKEMKKNKRKRKEKNNEPKKKRKKHTNDENTVTEEEKNIKERGKGEEVKEKKEKKVSDEENDEKKDMQKNLNEKEKSNEGKRKKDKNEKNSFEEDTESNVKRRKKKRKLITKEENKKRDKMKEKGKKETDDEKEHQKKDLQEEKRNKVKSRKRKDGRKKENDITDSIENNSKEGEKNDLMKEKDKKGKETGKRNKEKKEPEGISKDSEEHRKKRRKHRKNKEEEKERKKKRKEVTKKSLYITEKLQSPPIFIQDEEQSFAKDMKNKSKQIEEDVKKSKMAVESIVKQLKELFPDPCTSISNNINQLRLNVSQIRQKIQLARTIVSSMKIPVSLNGKQHVEMMLNQKSESKEIQTSVEICIKPRTTNSVILSLQANNSISYSLALVDSKPLLTILDMNGEMLMKLEPDTKLIKNNWYQFLIHRNSRNFSLSVNPTDSKYERITVQKVIPGFSPEQIPLSLVSLGGYPENFPISNSENLKGCIAYLNVNGHSTHIFSPLKSGLYPSVCKTDSEYSTNTSMVFEGNGFALLESDVYKKPFTLVHLTFKTFKKNALLMSIKSNSKLLFLVTLIEGNIHVERKGKASSIAKQSQGTEFSNGQPHSIQVTVKKNQLEIKTSSEEVEFEDKDASGDEMLFDEGISLGGLASSVRNESKYRSFTGCLSNVSIDNTPLNLLYLKDGRHVYQGDCQGNVWISCAQFTESSVPVTLTKYDHVRSISLMVSSQAQGVALFFERKEKFSIKLQLTTISLEVFDYKNDENEIIPKKNGSGFWHLLHIEDQEGNIHITLDGGQSVDMVYKANTGWFYSNADDFSMFVTVGGLPKDHEHFKKLDTFIGSVSSLFIQQLPLDLDKEFGSSNNLSVCAKPTGELFTSKLNCINSIGG